MTPERLAEIEARAAKATVGPWTSRNGDIWSPGLGPFPSIVVETDGGLYWRQDPRSWDEKGKSPGPDQDFIAHAREDVPALVAEVKRLEKLRVDYSNALLALGRDDLKTALAHIRGTP